MCLEICLAGICHCYGDVLEKGSNFSNSFSKQWSCPVVFIIPRNLMTVQSLSSMSSFSQAPDSQAP